MTLQYHSSPRFLSPVLASRRRSAAVFALFLAAVLVLPGILQAQETTATIRGLVVDASGTPVPNAQIEVLDQRTGTIRNFSTNDSGAFLATRLSPGGPYTVIVNQTRTVIVESISVSNIYNLTIETGPVQLTEEIEVVADASTLVDVAPGPAATFNTFEVETAPAFSRDIVEVYGIDPRINIDNEERGFQVNCAGKHPRFNSVTLDGVSYNDRFGLNSNGYNTAVGMPFPFDGISQVAVELAPFDVTYGGFSACNINAVTKSGSNTFTGNVFYEYTGDNLRRNIGEVTPDFNDRNWGATFGGPVIKDKLFFFAAYENSSQFVPLAMGYRGSGNGVERPWFSQADYDRIDRIARTSTATTPGASPATGPGKPTSSWLKLDWNINRSHKLAFIFNYFDGFEDRASDNDSNEFEFANHFYQKGAKSKTFTVKLTSQWTNAVLDRAVPEPEHDGRLPGHGGARRISASSRSPSAVATALVYLGADDSRQANALNTDSDFVKLAAQYLAGRARHQRRRSSARSSPSSTSSCSTPVAVSTASSTTPSGNPAYCAALTAQGRLDDPGCQLSGIDRFELGRPSRIYYGSGGGTNDPVTASAEFSNALNSLYVQDEIFFDQQNLTVVAGLRYEFFTQRRPARLQPDLHQRQRRAAQRREHRRAQPAHAAGGLHLGRQRRSYVIRGGVGRYSGGNPNVWLSNAWSNDGLTNVQTQLSNDERGRIDPGRQHPPDRLRARA